MKKKISFKISAIILALVICLVPTLTVLANASGEVKVPIVNVHGLMASDIYVDPSDPNSELAWPPSQDSILNAIKTALPELAKLAVTKDWKPFGDALVSAATDMFIPIYCADDGTVGNGSGIRFTYPSAYEIKNANEVDFRYDWRIDPIEVAEQLNDFINYVLDCSGSDTVKICCHSLGGVITNTYLTIYGDDKVSGVCFNSTAVFGQTYIGELMTGQVVLDSQSLQDFLSFAFDYNEYKNLLNEIIAIVRQAGLMDVVVNLGNTIIDNLLEQISIEVLAPMFANWLSIWAMTRDEDIEVSEDFMFNVVCNGFDRSALKSKVDRFNTEIRPYKSATLQKLNENASVYVISRYGYCSIPLTPSWSVPSDGVVDVHSTSFGATVTPYGDTFGDEYLANAKPEYISPDKTVDASTCMFPEQTWFIKNMQHANNPRSLKNMMYSLLRYDGQATVDTFAKYPRFCKYFSANDVIEPYSNAEHPMTFGYRIGCVVKELITLVVNLISRIVSK